MNSLLNVILVILLIQSHVLFYLMLLLFDKFFTQLCISVSLGILKSILIESKHLECDSPNVKNVENNDD